MIFGNSGLSTQGKLWMPLMESLETRSQREKEIDRELAATERALAQETLEHARTKETLAYTRGLLERADKNEGALHQFIDKQEVRNHQLVDKLEDKVIDANRKIATIARELGAKEERIALLSGSGSRLPGVAKTPSDQEPLPRSEEKTSFPKNILLFFAGVGLTLSFGIWSAYGWELETRIAGTAFLWWVMAWIALKYWAEVAKVNSLPASPRFQKMTKISGFADLSFIFLAVAYLAFFIFGS